MLLLMLLAGNLAACSHPPTFVAPEIDPPADLIPGYVPEGYELVSGFQLPPQHIFQETSNGDDVSNFQRIHVPDLKSPMGNDVLGVYYQGKEDLILISKSYYPGGTLDLWRAAYEASGPKPCECVWIPLRLSAVPLPPRLAEIEEERTIEGVRVAILDGPQNWITVFVRGDYFVTVESGISLEENLKIVPSLLKS